MSQPTKSPNAAPPVRIPVRTITHLIPGTGKTDKTNFILNRMCQYHWNCDFSTPKFRSASYNAKFASNNKCCFFVVDYGEPETNDVLVLSYEWGGESLNPLPNLTQERKAADILRLRAPFTGRLIRYIWHIPVRKSVGSRLECEDTIPEHEIEYLKRHPGDVEWLKRNIKPRLWRKFVADQNANGPSVSSGVGEVHFTITLNYNGLACLSHTSHAD